MPQPVIIAEEHGVIEEVNNALCELYGYERQQVIGKTPRMLNPGRAVYHDFGYDEDDYNDLFRSLWKSISDPNVASWHGTVINRKSDDTLIWVELLIRGLKDKSGRVSKYIALPVDISNLKALERRDKIDLYRALAELSELRDNETGNHMKRVGIFSRLLAKELGMPPKFCEDIELFAPMHDIGKVGIPDSILLAPRALTPAEESEMRRHTVLGHAIVAGKSEMSMAAEITIGHHEKWDGSGYPRNLEGEAIPLSARIAALADVYDALRSHRSYKEPWPHERALTLIEGKAASHFDPSVVNAFAKVADSFEAIYGRLEDR